MPDFDIEKDKEAWFALPEEERERIIQQLTSEYDRLYPRPRIVVGSPAVAAAIKAVRECGAEMNRLRM